MSELELKLGLELGGVEGACGCSGVPACRSSGMHRMCTASTRAPKRGEVLNAARGLVLVQPDGKHGMFLPGHRRMVLGQESSFLLLERLVVGGQVARGILKEVLNMKHLDNSLKGSRQFGRLSLRSFTPSLL